MKSFFNLRHTRYTAIVMLFVWLMTLGISVANACLVDIEHDHHAPAMQAQAAHHADDDHDADEHTLASDKAVCLTVCAAEEAVAVKSKGLDVPSDSQVVPVAWLPALTIALADLNDRSAPLAPPIWYEPPVSIRFLRLTI